MDYDPLELFIFKKLLQISMGWFNCIDSFVLQMGG